MSQNTQFETKKITWTRALLVPICGVAMYSGTAWADRIDTIRILLHEGKTEAAENRCERWNASSAMNNTELREVCAQVFWRRVEQSDRFDDWVAYRKTWSGTSWAELALKREAGARLASLEPNLSETDLLALSELYSGTSDAPAFRALAADAAVRDVQDGPDALRVAETWPLHSGLPQLVEQYPEHFLNVTVDERTVAVTLKEPFDIPLNTEPEWRWMAQNNEEELADWDSTVVSILTAWGVQSEVTQSLPTETGLARLPICTMVDPPGGWQPVLKVSLGESHFLRPVSPDSGCDDRVWPVFVSHIENRVVGVSLRPGHRLDLRASPDDPDIRGLVQGTMVGDAVLGPDGIYQQRAAIQVVQPLSGGAAWATLRSAGQWSQPFGIALHLDPVPEGWNLVAMDDDLQVRSEVLAKMPPALRNWRIVPGDVAVVPLQMRDVIGLTQKRAKPPRPPAPEMTSDSGWRLDGQGALLHQPPDGASIAGLYQMGPEELQLATGVLSAMSLMGEGVSILDGWKVDLDEDRAEEWVLRANGNETGLVFVLDAVNPERSIAADNARVFGWKTDVVGTETESLSTPFPFQKGGYIYLGWSAADEAGTQLEIVRSDGTGFVSDRFRRP